MKKRLMFLMLFTVCILLLFPVHNKVNASGTGITYDAFYKSDGALDYKIKYDNGVKVAKITYIRDSQGNYHNKYVFSYKDNGDTLVTRYEYRNDKKYTKINYVKDSTGIVVPRYIFVYKADGVTLSYRYVYDVNTGKKSSKYIYVKNNGKYQPKYIYSYKTDGKTIDFKYSLKNNRIYAKSIYTKDGNGKYRVKQIISYKIDGKTVNYKYTFKNGKKYAKYFYTKDSNGKIVIKKFLRYGTDGKTITDNFIYKNGIKYIRYTYKNRVYKMKYLYDTTGSNITTSYIYKDGKFVFSKSYLNINKISATKKGTEQNPVEIGTQVNWGVDIQGQNLDYTYIVYRNNKVEYIVNRNVNSFSYKLDNYGKWKIKVIVKNDKGSQASIYSEEIKVRQPIKVISLLPSVESPQKLGSSTIFTCIAEGEGLEYEFYYKYDENAYFFGAEENILQHYSNNNKIDFNNVDIGYYSIIVHVKDKYGYEASFKYDDFELIDTVGTFNLAHEKENNDTKSTATKVTLNNQVYGKINYNDKDYYKINIDEEGKFTAAVDIKNKSSWDTQSIKFSLYNENGDKIDDSKSVYGEIYHGYQQEISVYVIPGTYYIKVQRFNYSMVEDEYYLFIKDLEIVGAQ